MANGTTSGCGWNAARMARDSWARPQIAMINPIMRQHMNLVGETYEGTHVPGLIIGAQITGIDAF